jgi:hypothetical protein
MSSLLPLPEAGSFQNVHKLREGLSVVSLYWRSNNKREIQKPFSRHFLFIYFVFETSCPFAQIKKLLRCYGNVCLTEICVHANLNTHHLIYDWVRAFMHLSFLPMI